MAQTASIKWLPSSGSRNCLQVAFLDDGTVAVRDAIEPTRVQHYSGAAWDEFLTAVRAGAFDRP